MRRGCQASKTAFRSHCARPTGRYTCVSEASCPNFEPRAHARLTGLTSEAAAPRRARSDQLKLNRPKRLPDVAWPAARRGANMKHFGRNVRQRNARQPYQTQTGTSRPGRPRSKPSGQIGNFANNGARELKIGQNDRAPHILAPWLPMCLSGNTLFLKLLPKN